MLQPTSNVCAGKSHDGDWSEAASLSSSQVWGWGLLLIVLTAAAYLPAFRAGFIWQDDLNVTHNPLLRSTAGLWRIWADPSAAPRFQPLAYTAFWAQHHLWGNGPAGYHAVGIMLHGANVLLLWTLLRRLAVPGAWLAAALFALHPVQVQTVAWVSQQGTLLSAFCFLSALLAYLRWAEVTPADLDVEDRVLRLGLPSHPVLLYGVTLLLATAALLSHPVAAVWPLAAALIVWWKTGGWSRRDLWPLLPFLLLAAAAVALFLVISPRAAVTDETYLRPVQRLFAAAGAVWVGLLEFAVPRPGGFSEPGWPYAPRTGLAYLFPFGLYAVAVVAVTAVLWGYRQRLGAGLLVRGCCLRRQMPWRPLLSGEAPAVTSLGQSWGRLQRRQRSVISAAAIGQQRAE